MLFDPIFRVCHVAHTKIRFGQLICFGLCAVCAATTYNSGQKHKSYLTWMLFRKKQFPVDLFFFPSDVSQLRHAREAQEVLQEMLKQIQAEIETEREAEQT